MPATDRTRKQARLSATFRLSGICWPLRSARSSSRSSACTPRNGTGKIIRWRRRSSSPRARALLRRSRPRRSSGPRDLARRSWNTFTEMIGLPGFFMRSAATKYGPQGNVPDVVLPGFPADDQFVEALLRARAGRHVRLHPGGRVLRVQRTDPPLHSAGAGRRAGQRAAQRDAVLAAGRRRVFPRFP